MQKVLIIGGGPAGLESALTLANAGYQVIIAEQSDALGGNPRFYTCKALDECRRCGACLTAEKALRVRNHPAIDVRLNAELHAAREMAVGFHAVLNQAGTLKEETVKAVVVATGHGVYDAARRPEFLYGREPRIITVLELEKRLRAAPDWETVLGPLPRLAFIQCFGSRDCNRGVPYCSGVCCLYTNRLAGMLTEGIAGCTADVFYMDRQQYDPVYGSMENRGAEYIRGIPSRAERDGDAVSLRYEAVMESEVRTGSYDWIILCAAMIPGLSTGSISSLFGLQLDQDGFIAVSEGGRTSVRGVYAAGTAVKPLTILEALRSGQEAALSFTADSGFQLAHH